MHGAWMHVQSAAGACGRQSRHNARMRCDDRFCQPSTLSGLGWRVAMDRLARGGGTLEQSTSSGIFGEIDARQLTAR